VLTDVKEDTTVAGVPAKEVGDANTETPGWGVDQSIVKK
jgi:serine acetyltransferase